MVFDCDYPMYMVRHDLKRTNLHARKMFRDLSPTFIDNFTDLRHPYLPVNNLSEDTPAMRSADGDEILTGLGVVTALQSQRVPSARYVMHEANLLVRQLPLIR